MLNANIMKNFGNLQKIIMAFLNFYLLHYYRLNIFLTFSTISSDIIQLYNDLINKGNFEKKGNNIIKFLFSNFSLYSKKKENNIIKKLEEIKHRNNNNLIRLKNTINKSSTNIFKNSSNNFKKILFNKDINIYEKKKVNDKRKNTETHLEKEELPIFNLKAPVKIQIEDDIKDNININSIINAKNRIKKEDDYRTIWKNNKYYKKEDDYDELDDIDLDIDLNYNTENNKDNRRPIIFNNNINNFNNINNINNKNNYINNYQTEKVYSDRSHKSREYIHKKFNSTLTGFRSTKDINILNQSQSDKEGAYNTIDFNNYNFDAYSNMINNINNNNLSNKIFPENTSIRKVKIIEIDPKKDINIGFELGNSECRISIINKGLNDILIWQPYDIEEINIPTVISFKEKVIIGKEAEEEIIKNPEYTIFNFLRLIGKNWDEINERKELFGYKLYNNNKTERPYVKINQKNYRNKIYNMEDILTLFLKNIFELFFSKIKIKEKKCDLIKINFIITVPNNFNYLQRKVIEKIFLTQLFNKKPNKENLYYLGKNGIENIQIKNIKIENSSNLGFLYYFQKEIENANNEEKESRKNNNIILIYIEGSSVNISLINNTITSTKYNKNEENMNKYEIKDIKWISFGEEDFTDILEYYLLDEKIKEEYKKHKISLPQIRKEVENIKNNFYKENQGEINIKNFNNKKNLKLFLNKKDLEKKCNEQFNQIVELIKELIKKSSISEIEINDIIFIGNKTTVNIIKEKLEIIFKNKNKNIYEKLLERDNEDKIETNENFIAIGAAIQSYNIFSIEKAKRLYKYKEITPISFGIEGLNKKMIFMIKKGDQLPIKVNKNMKFKITKEDIININIYEGEEEYSYKNRLISKANVETANLNDEIKVKDYVEIMIQFTLNQNYDLRVFILDTKSLKRKLECVINIDIIQE